MFVLCLAQLPSLSGSTITLGQKQSITQYKEINNYLGPFRLFRCPFRSPVLCCCNVFSENVNTLLFLTICRKGTGWKPGISYMTSEYNRGMSIDLFLANIAHTSDSTFINVCFPVVISDEWIIKCLFDPWSPQNDP